MPQKRAACSFVRRRVFPHKAKVGDQVRVLALSRSLGGIMHQAGFSEADVEFARARLEALGFQVSFGEHVMECNAQLTASIESRIEDLHGAVADPSVKVMLAVSGGIGAIQLLEHIDYDLVASNPKILCGYSDIAYLSNAFLAKTGLVTYYGPNFSSFMMRQGFEYTAQHFRKCLFDAEPFAAEPSEHWSDDPWSKDQETRTFLPNPGYWPLVEGEAEGVVVGGSGNVLNMLQGSAFFPSLEGAILFLESPGEGKASLMALDSCLRSLSYQGGFDGVRGLVIGRYPRSSRIDRSALADLVRGIPALANIPSVANVDFGHTTPVMTVPIGGTCRLQVEEQYTRIMFSEH